MISDSKVRREFSCLATELRIRETADEIMYCRLTLIIAPKCRTRLRSDTVHALGRLVCALCRDHNHVRSH